MIRVTINKVEIRVEGHAGFASPGQDIICAGVSTLVITLISSLEKLVGYYPEYLVDSGNFRMNIEDLPRDAHLLVESFLVGLLFIQEEAPTYIKCPSIEDIKSNGFMVQA